MRVLNIQLKHTQGGVLQASLDYVRMLRHAGNDVLAVTNRLDPFVGKLEDTGANVLKAKNFGVLRSLDFVAVGYFRKIVNEFKPDVIVCHEGKTAVLMRKVVGNRIPIVAVNHGGKFKRFEKADGVVVVNKAKQKEAFDYLGRDKFVCCIPNAIDLDGCSGLKIGKKRQKIPVLGVIGIFFHVKGFDVFIDALNILKLREVKFNAVIGGDGEQREVLEQRIAEYGLGEIVDMVGWVSDSSQFYSKIDIFCLPSRSESFGLVLLEAWRAGLPAVVTDTDGPLNIVENEVNALMVPRENAEALADAFERLINDEKKAGEIAEAGYKKLVEEYDVGVVALRLQAVLSEVVNVSGQWPVVRVQG